MGGNKCFEAVFSFRLVSIMNENKYYLYSGTARQILAGLEEVRANVEVSVDLNKSVRTLDIKGDHVLFDCGSRLTREELLLASGAQVCTKDGAGKTSLQRAASKGHMEVVELLRQHGAK